MKVRICVAVAALLPGAAWAQSPAALNAPPPVLSQATPAAADARAMTVAADMQAVLDQWAAMKPVPIATLTPVVARLQPTLAEAARAAMRRAGLSTAPDATVTTRELHYGADAMQYARLYTPVAAAGHAAALPVVVYYHGGGWVLGDLDGDDATPRYLSQQLNAIVVSVAYRRAPEFVFPAPHDDAAAAYRWVTQNVAAWGGNPVKIALAGEGAGGNLAVATAIAARDQGLPRPVHVLAVDPIANSDATLPSRRDAGQALPFDATTLAWGAYHLAGDPRDPRLDLVHADLRGLPPLTVVDAQLGPLRSDGETLAQAVKAAGGRVEQRTFAGVTDGFFGMGQVVRGAYDAERYAVARLKSAFGQ